MKIKKIALIILTIVFVSSLFGAVAYAAESDGVGTEGTSVVKYIKNSYTSGAYMFEENGYLRYGIPLSANETEYQWEFIEHEGYYQIKNVATGHSITLSGGTGLKTSVRNVTKVGSNDLWKIDATLPSDESQNFTSASTEYSGVSLHIIELTDGYVASEEIGSMYSYGEAKWALYDENEMNFEGVIRDGFCIGYNNFYLTVHGEQFVFEQPTGPDDNFIWKFEWTDNGKKIFNLGQGKYLALSDGALNLVNEAQATDFTMFVSNAATITTENNGLAVSGSILQVMGKSNASDLRLVLASVVGTVLGDLKLDGIYTLTNSWFSMYMLDDGGIPTYGNSSPDNTQIQWEIIYNETNGLSALKNVGRNEYLYMSDGKLTFSKDIIYYWKVLRSSNDLYPNAIRFQDSTNPSAWLHMENTNGQLECTTAVQSTWGSPHWEPVQYDANAKASMEAATIETGKWFRIKSLYSNNLYIYQTNGGFAYGSVSEMDARSHWEFQKDGDEYLIYNRNFDMYISSFGNGYLTKTEYKEDATRFGINKYVSDGTYLIYEKNDKEYLANYINIQNRDSLVHLSLVSVDIRETRWILEVAPEEIETNDIVINNTVLSTFNEQGRYSFDGQTVSVEHYANYVRVSNSDGKYLYTNSKGKTAWKKFTNDYDTNFYFNYTIFGDDMQLTRGETTLMLQQIGADRTFRLADGFVIGNQSTLSVYAATAKEYTVQINTLQDGISNTVSVDGIVATTFRTGELTEFDLKLHQGNNLVKFTRIDAIESIVIKDIISNGYQGATQGVTAYELENYTTNANVEVDNRDHHSMTSEAMGRSFVNLEKITDYVEVKLLNDMQALTLRYSVPDTKDGKGTTYTLSMYVNGKDTANLILSSEKAHLYKDWDYTNNPADGYHHVFFDEVTYVFDEVQPVGTVIRFRRDFDDEADYYALDLLETELLPEKIEKPTNALSITDYGAIANDGLDDTLAIQQCLADAARQRREVYIPEGVFEIHKTIEISANNMVVRGAGYWYTRVNGMQFTVNASNVAIYSMKLVGDHDNRRDTIDRGCIEMQGEGPTNLVIANVWMNYYKCGAWLSFVDQVFISGNRIHYTYADGINLHAGVVDAVVENNSIRSTGDDGLAAWSDGSENTNLHLRYNNIENPWLANCIALYGGTNLYIYNNICKDTAYVGAGVNISTNFMPTNFKGELKVFNNLIVRCGSDDNATNKDVGGIWFNMVIGYDAFAAMEVKNNVILDSTHQGISFYGTSIICSLIVEENVINNSGSYGIDISSEFNGKMFLKNNSINGSMLDDILEGYSARNAEVVIVNDIVEITTDNSLKIVNAVLWSVGAVASAGAVILTVFLARIRKKGGRAAK